MLNFRPTRIAAIAGCAVFLVLSSSSRVHGQVADPAAEHTITEIMRMKVAGVSDDVVLAMLKNEGKSYNLTPDELIHLQQAGINETIVRSLLTVKKAVPDSTPVSSIAVPPVPKVVARPDHAPADPALPTDIGVYAKKADQWIEVLPEIVNWKTGGVVKALVTSGIVKEDVNGHINGADSKASFALPVQFLIVLPEGTAITEYQLLKLRKNSTNREFRTVTGGVFHVSSGATRDLRDFDSQKIAPHTYEITLNPILGAGEYGFLPPGAVGAVNAAGSRGKLYTFRLTE
jgi:hypothetical protein